MRLKKDTPGGGGGSRAESFSNVKVPPSLKTWTAYCAGEPYWCRAHEHTDKAPGTKVCLHWVTDGALHCPRCKPYFKLSRIAYVPLYREMDNKAVFVICHETVEDMLNELSFGVEVMVGRVEACASIFVKRSAGNSRYKSTMPTRQEECDLTKSLLSVWKYPQLDEWFLAQERAAPKLQAGTAVKPNGQAFKPEYQAAAKRYGATVVPPTDPEALFGVVTENAIERAKIAENHKAKKNE